MLSDSKVLQDRKACQDYGREHAELSKIVAAYREHKRIVKELKDCRELLRDDDPEMKELAREDAEQLSDQKAELEEKLRLLLIPKDPLDSKNVLIEIRAGTGGEEAGLFAGDLFNMYSRYAENQRWKVEVMTQHVTGGRGY